MSSHVCLMAFDLTGILLQRWSDSIDALRGQLPEDSYCKKPPEGQLCHGK
jgi:hypothetical protein